ncbi:MAG TPA: hypothetical protein VMW81_07485 [Nitrospinota bacterium]|nr:hypothetical protein [Nitrospinota bacterium]
MAPINIIAIVLGMIIVITRLPGIIWPKNMREFIFKFLENTYAIKLTGLFLFILSLIIFFLFLKERTIVEMIIIILGLIWLPLGIMIFFYPDLYRNLGQKVMGKSLTRIRVLCSIGCFFGLLLILLGLFG